MSFPATDGVGLARLQGTEYEQDTQGEGEDFAPQAGNAGDARPLEHNEVKGIVQREIEDSLGGLGSQVSDQQRTNVRMYYGRPLGNEVKDRSSVVMMDVLEVVEWTMPSLMRMFTGGRHIAKFKPRHAEHQDNADLATEYLNHVFMNEIDGFQIIYDWFKTALIEKNGVVKVYWEERREPRVDTYKGLTIEELAMLLEDGGDEEREVELLSAEPKESELEGQPVTVYDVEMRIWRTDKGIKVDGIPPEEFLIARRAITLDDRTQFSGHRKKQTVSDLVAMGYPFSVVKDIPSDDTPEYSQGRTERLSEDETYPVTTAERRDAASRDVWTTECYIRMDEDGDGYAELRRVLIIGEQAVTILDDEEVNQNPFVSVCPVPMAHKFFGLSLADLVVDLQVIRSTLVRQILDHTYLSTNPRLAITEGMVEVEDLLTSRPGGIVRQRAPGNIEPIMLPPLPGETFQLLSYMEDVRSNRTGVMSHGQDLDASAVNATMGGMAALSAEKQQKVELIGRIFADGVKKLFRKMLRLMVENDTKERQVRINGRFVKINPATWDADMDLEVEVGHGAGSSQQQAQNIQTIQAVQAGLGAAGMSHLVSPDNAYAGASRLAEEYGFTNPELFFTDPQGQPPPPPPPDPKIEELKLKAIEAEAAQQNKAGELALAAEKEKNIVAHRRAELEMKMDLETKRIHSEERIRLGQQEATLEAARISASGREEPAEETSDE